MGVPQSALAQSITTANDGAGTIIQHNGNTYNISGGTQAGANLFHSFEQFGLQPNEIADFLSNPAIQNVVGRVVGGDPSVVEGLIRVSGGNSNLFLVNPAGWLFTNGASVDVAGSFGVTTATRVGFGDEFFNAIGTNNYAALTGDLTSLIFDSAQPGAIINSADLKVDQGSLWMVGGSVINTGTIDAPNGTVTLAAVPGQSRVKLKHEGMTLGLVLDALAVDEVASDAPLGLKATDLPRYLAGGSDLGSATGLTQAKNGTLWLVGSEMQVVEGDVVIGDRVTADTIDLIATNRVQVTDTSLVQGDTTVVRLPDASGRLTYSAIDSRADTPHDLLFGGTAGTIATLIQRDEDGIDAVTADLAEIAEDGGKVDAVSITAEGHEGNFWLGNAWVTHESIGDYKTQLASWGKALTENADILLYSCFTALGATGDVIVNTLANFTGADVAASTDATGSENYDADWTLERSTGIIEAATPFTDETLANWDGKLATITVANLNNTGAGSLREAIQTDAAAGDTIAFAAGLTGTITLDGTGNITGQNHVQDNRGTTGAIFWQTDNLTLDGDNRIIVSGDNNSRVFSITAANATIENITVQEGRITSDVDNVYGAGIYHTGAGDLTVENAIITNNTTVDLDGLATGVSASGASINLDGAGIGVGRENVTTGGSLIIRNSVITGNETTDDGGGIAVRNGRSLSIYNSTISNNIAGGTANSNGTQPPNSDGGGISINSQDTTTNSTVIIQNTRIENNVADRQGGGIAITNGANITITESTIAGNTVNGISTNQGGTDLPDAFRGGGAISSDGDSTITVERSTLSGNRALGVGTNNGGGAINIATRTATDGGNPQLTLRNTTISNNSTSSNGGAILFTAGAGSGSNTYTATGTLTSVNNTIAFNSAANSGGGIFTEDANTEAHTIHNTILSNNSAPTASQIGTGTGGTFANSDVQFSIITDTAGATGLSGSIINVDPGLIALDDNGGVSSGANLGNFSASVNLTHLIPSGSSAEDAGSDALAAGLTSDQRSTVNGFTFERIFGGSVDIGAIEIQPIPDFVTFMPEVAIAVVRVEQVTAADPNTVFPLNTFLEVNACLPLVRSDLVDHLESTETLVNWDGFELGEYLLYQELKRDCRPVYKDDIPVNEFELNHQASAAFPGLESRAISQSR